MIKSKCIKAYRHKGIDYKLIVISWLEGESLAYLSKRLENGVIVARHSIFKGIRSWCVLNCFSPDVAECIKKQWLGY